MKEPVVTVEERSWVDTAFPIVLEILLALVGDYYIISRELEKSGFVSLPFVLGLLITTAVGGFAIHFMITKKNRLFVGASFACWLIASVVIVTTAAIAWQADNLTKAHNAELAAVAEQQTKTTNAQTEAELKLIGKQQEILNQTKDKGERALILRNIVTVGKKADAPKTEDGQPPALWQPFEKGTFLAFWHDGASNYMGLIGLILGAVLMGIRTITRGDFATSAKSGKTVVTTEHEVIPTHAPIGFGTPVVAQDQPGKSKRLIK